MFNDFIKKFLNALHVSMALTPILIFFLPINLVKPYSHWLLFFSIMVPLHWVFIENQCLLTMISKQLGDYKDSKTNSEFTENNLKEVYLPIMKFFNWKWDNDGLQKMSTFHWVMNILFVWYYSFYITGYVSN
mgnify:FL=1